MIKHKGWVLLIAIIAVFIGGSWGIYHHYYGGQPYYTQIVSDGKRIEEKDSEGETIVDYRYQQKAYNEKGEAKAVDFNGTKSVPLKHHAYLKLIVNNSKGVMSWEKVAETEVPTKAKNALDK